MNRFLDLGILSLFSLLILAFVGFIAGRSFTLNNDGAVIRITAFSDVLHKDNPMYFISTNDQDYVCVKVGAPNE